MWGMEEWQEEVAADNVCYNVTTDKESNDKALTVFCKLCYFHTNKDACGGL